MSLITLFCEKAVKAVAGIALAALAVGAALPASAKPADRRTRTYTQPDGTEITLSKHGDEHSHYYLTDKGQVVVDKAGAYVYTRLKGATLEPTDALVGEASPEGFATIADASVQQAMAVKAGSNPRLAPRRGPGLFATGFPAIGTQKVLVILVDYPNKGYTLSDPHDYFSRMLTQEGFSDYGGTGSALQYFVDNSLGKFTPEFDVYGPVTLAHNYSYYGENDWWGSDKRPWEMVIEACQMLDDEIDFSQYDRDNDGYIDNVYVFYAGKGEASYGAANTVWPHSWNIQEGTGQTYRFDGKILDRYATSNEWESSAPDGIGTFVHEFSHVLGLPDLYATDYTTAFTPGDWSVLDSGPYNNDGRTPPAYGAFERYALDWIQPREINGACSVTLAPVLEQGDACIIRTDKDNEYFLLENRQKTSWDNYIPGHGMLVWHIDYNPGVWEANSVNNTASHQYVDLEEADGTRSESSRAGDAFPGTGHVTSFTDDTDPSMRTWAGQPLGLPITDIAETDGVITFLVDGGAPLPPGFETFSPVATEATGIGPDGFTANWEPMDDAVEYFLDVYTLKAEATVDDTCDFTGGIKGMPEGWSTNSALTYAMASYSGEAAPSLRLSASGNYVSTSVCEGGISALSFWHRGQKVPEANDLRVYALCSGEWTLVRAMAVETAAGGAVTEITDFPAGSTAVKIEYNAVESAGSVAVDDITVTGTRAALVPVDGYQALSVGGALQYDVVELEADTEYRYCVTASDGNVLSRPSNIVTVRTIRTTGITSALASASIRLDGRRLWVTAAEGTEVSVCDMQGRTLGRAVCDASGRASITVPGAGIYLVHTPMKASKITVR